MKRTKNRMAVCLTLTALTLAFIWGNSLLPAEASRALSTWLRDLLAPLFGGEASPGTESVGHGLLRKVAHFTEFCWLGLCLSWLMHMLRTKKTEVFLFAAAAGVAVACIDEGIQFFVPGRGPGWMDVGIDTAGLLLGIGVITLIHYISQQKMKLLEEQKR